MKSPQIGVLCALFASLAVVVLTTANLSAAEPAANETKPSEASPAPVKGQWEPIHEGTGGVAVDRSNGDVYLVVTGKEIFKEKEPGHLEKRGPWRHVRSRGWGGDRRTL